MVDLGAPATVSTRGSFPDRPQRVGEEVRRMGVDEGRARQRRHDHVGVRALVVVAVPGQAQQLSRPMRGVRGRSGWRRSISSRQVTGEAGAERVLVTHHGHDCAMWAGLLIAPTHPELERRPATSASSSAGADQRSSSPPEDGSHVVGRRCVMRARRRSVESPRYTSFPPPRDSASSSPGAASGSRASRASMSSATARLRRGGASWWRSSFTAPARPRCPHGGGAR